MLSIQNSQFPSVVFLFIQKHLHKNWSGLYNPDLKIISFTLRPMAEGRILPSAALRVESHGRRHRARWCCASRSCSPRTFSSVSFCFSVSVPSKSSLFRATSFKSSFSLLLPRVHCSKGDTFPYHSSLMISIMFVPPVSTQQYHRWGRKSRPFSKQNQLFSTLFL